MLLLQKLLFGVERVVFEKCLAGSYFHINICSGNLTSFCSHLQMIYVLQQLCSASVIVCCATNSFKTIQHIWVSLEVQLIGHNEFRVVDDVITGYSWSRCCNFKVNINLRESLPREARRNYLPILLMRHARFRSASLLVHCSCTSS